MSGITASTVDDAVLATIAACWMYLPEVDDNFFGITFDFQMDLLKKVQY